MTGSELQEGLATGEPRFGFGRNWQRFLSHLDESRIEEAERSLAVVLGERLDGMSFLDIGSGSGLFSLAALRMGATRVHSLDYDADSVACAVELRRRFFPESAAWTVEQGDATDAEYMRGLGTFDIVYSWGVLHHTGDLWTSMENACAAAGKDGRLFIALYNDRGWRSELWTRIKRFYSGAPGFLRPLLVLIFGAPGIVRSAIYETVRGHPARFFTRWTRTGLRGMTGWHDLVDWIGGYPYEASKPEQVWEFCRQRGFDLEWLETVNTLGNNQFLFARKGAAHLPASALAEASASGD